MANKKPVAIGIFPHTRKVPWSLAIVLIIVLTHMFVIFASPVNLLNWYSSDDAFYYFKIAANIASGRGSTFDGINPTNGYHPLWMLVCIPVFSLSGISKILALRILAVVSIALNACTCILLFRLLCKFISEPIAFIGALLWALTPTVNLVTVQGGLEAGLSALMIVLFLLFSVEYREKELEEKKFRKLSYWD